MLQYSWKYNHKNLEIKSYDFLGIVYYNLNDLMRAKFFHNKMALYDYETDDSF